MAAGHGQDGGRGAGRARRGLSPPAELESYLAQVAARLRAALGAELLAVWLAGSAAAGAYEHGRSDVDVIAAARGPLREDARRLVVERVRHEALPCPARKLELVVHRAGELAHGRPGVELNLETGEGGTSTPAVDGFWFVIDLSVVRARGVALDGPAPDRLVAEPPHEAVMAALAASLEWHGGPAAQADDAVLNACRALRYAAEGRWSAKREAGEWAAAAGHAPAQLVAAALALRAGRPGERLEAAAVSAFLDSAYRAVAARMASSRSGRLNS